MRKKVLSIIIVAVMFIQLGAFAQISVEISDAANDIITISSSAPVGKPLSVMIVNPGYTKENALAGSDGAIQYFNSFVPASSNYNIPIKIMGNNGGKFEVYIKSSNGREEGNFTFYNAAFKQKCIDDINTASSGENIAPYLSELLKAYGKSEDSAFVTLGLPAMADAFVLIKDTLPGKLLPSDTDAVYDVINKSILLASYNTKNEELCFSGDSILNSALIGIASSGEIADYKSNISSDGQTYIKQKLLSGGYKSIQDIANKFKSLVHRGVLLNYKNLGYGHIHSYLSSKYRTAYELAGFIIPEKESASKYNQLLALTDESLEALALKFNEFKETGGSDSSAPSSKPNPKPNSQGSVGSSASIGGGVSYVDPNPAPEVPPVQSGSAFSDVSSSHWALASVEFLKEKQWINGYEDGTFRPDNNITRAEYAKLILTVFGIKEGGQADFSDVSKDAWYAPFVAAAQANGIINGADGNFFPDKNLTRQDAAVIICRILDKASSEKLSFADSENIADYAISAVSYLSELGVINGYGDNTFKPEGYITRAEISKIIYTLNEKGGIK